jgi:hypothetical protein
MRNLFGVAVVIFVTLLGGPAEADVLIGVAGLSVLAHLRSPKSYAVATR